MRDGILSVLGNSFDIEYRDIEVSGVRICLIFVDENTDKETLSRDILRPITTYSGEVTPDGIRRVIACPVKVTLAKGIEELSQKVVDGNVVLVIDGYENSLVMNLKKFPMRPVMEPPTATVLKGPREGFTEDLVTNLSLLRRRLKTKDLRFDKVTIGRYTSADVVLTYIDGIASRKVIREVKNKLSRIDIDGVLDSSYIARFLEDRRHSIFRQIGTTEKPNILASKLLEGRVGIIMDGTPIVLTVPFILLENFQDGSDYFKRGSRVTMLRIVRVIAVFMAIILPGYYVALQEFQYQILPLKFLITLKNATQGLPLTPTLETFLVIILFEVLNETSVRMPKYVGMALSVVGAIVLGDTAVKAGILSSPAVLVIAVSGIGLYCVPDDAGAFSVLRILFVGMAGVLGVYGITMLGIFLLIYLCGLNSFGAPYLSPYAPIIESDLKDGILQGDIYDMKYRPKSIPQANPRRMEDSDEI